MFGRVVLLYLLDFLSFDCTLLLLSLLHLLQSLLMIVVSRLLDNDILCRFMIHANHLLDYTVLPPATWAHVGTKVRYGQL